VTLRPIDTRDYAAIDVPTSFGRPPRLEWVSIEQLVIDPEYQREITPRGRANVRRIAAGFDWAMFAPVVVAPAGADKFAIVDGQHRTTAAKICGVDRVPCAIIDVERATQARSFRAINGNVTRMHTIHLHHASVAAGDKRSLRIAEVCRMAGVTIVRNPTQASLLKIGETVVVTTIAKSIERFGEAATILGLKTVVATGGGQSGPSFQDHHLGRDRGPARSSRMVPERDQAQRRLRHHRSRGSLAPRDRCCRTRARLIVDRSIRGVAGRGAQLAFCSPIPAGGQPVKPWRCETMNVYVDETKEWPLLDKHDRNLPALKVTGRDTIVVRAGTSFGGKVFEVDTRVELPPALDVGADYAVEVVDGAPIADKIVTPPVASLSLLGGFHFAPGGNATARKGGDSVPAINPCSLWDLGFRPACPDPRGMALVEMSYGRKFWCDIYLTAKDAELGTSRFDVTIADGDDRPIDPATGKPFQRFDYASALALMRHHGKELLSFEEFAAAAFGVTEKTAHSGDPETTGLDAFRTSKFGLMQATGNLWVWGHDGDPDEPRASILGGSWFFDGYARSRYADLATAWPDDSGGDLGARGRCDHLQPV
jgi:hypothetical protein